MSDSNRMTEEARARLPLKSLIQQHGSGPRSSDEKWNSFECPFCHQTAGSVFRGDGGYDLFKCFYTGGKRGGPCPSGNKVLDEPGFIAQKLGVIRRDAWITWLKEAGVWKEERLAPSVLPGQRPRRKQFPDEDKSVPNESPEKSASQGIMPHNSNSNALNAEGPLQTEPDAPTGPATAGPQNAPSDGKITQDTADGAPFHGEMPGAETMGGDGADPVGDDAGAAGEEAPPAQGENGEPPPEDEAPEALKVLREFYAVATLTEADAEKLLAQRGLTAQTCADLGYRSSRKENRALLEGLRGKYSERALIDSGLFWKNPKGQVVVSDKFLGWGEKRKGSDGPVCDWVYPVLIPYFNAVGQLQNLRPHKDMPAGGRPRFYVARKNGQAEGRFERVVITEGEFKAGALKQVIPGYGVAAIPGIAMCKDDSVGTYPVVQELFAWLRSTGAKTVYVGFDNEEKADPKLPAFKADPRRRHDTQIWARYLAILLEKKGYDARVAWLPNEWRDEKGKADWDGVLSRMAAGQIKKAAPAEGPWRAPEARAAFLKVLQESKPANLLAHAGLFDGAVETIIQQGLDRLFYHPRLAQGGPKEMKVWKRLMAVVKKADYPAADKGLVAHLAGAYRDSFGGYYILKPLLKMKEDRDYWRERMSSCRKAENWDGAYVAEKLLNGLPVRFTDFVVEPLYSLKLANGSSIDRVVRLKNIWGESCVAKVDPESLSQPSHLRKWLLTNGNCKWGEGQQQLDDLQEDMNRVLSHRTVHQIATFGWDENARMWFFDDCGISTDGLEVLPDEDGIIWWNGLGYQISAEDREGEEFAQGRPQMHPGMGLARTETGWELLEGKDQEPALWELFGEFATRLEETLGGEEAWMGMGTILAFAVAPDFYRRNKWFSGLWIHGERGSGKTTVATYLMRLWGVMVDSGMNLDTCSRVGMMIASQQYSWIPLWFEEYRSDLDPAKVAVIRAYYNRDLGVKKEFEATRRRILTNVIVTGEATSHDSATRQRFSHLQVAEARRRERHLEWFEDQSSFFFVWGDMCCAIARNTWNASRNITASGRRGRN